MTGMIDGSRPITSPPKESPPMPECNSVGGTPLKRDPDAISSPCLQLSFCEPEPEESKARCLTSEIQYQSSSAPDIKPEKVTMQVDIIEVRAKLERAVEQGSTKWEDQSEGVQTARRPEGDAKPRRPWHQIGSPSVESSMAVTGSEDATPRRPWRKTSESLLRSRSDLASSSNTTHSTVEEEAKLTDISNLDVKGRFSQSNAKKVAEKDTKEILGGMVRYHQQQMSSMKEQIDQEVASLRLQAQHEQASARQVHDASVEKMLADVQHAHAMARTAQQDAYKWELHTMSKKLRASKEASVMLEKQVSAVKAQLQDQQEKQKKLESAASEVSALRDEKEALLKKAERYQGEIEQCKHTLQAVNENADDLEIQVSEYAEQARVAKSELQANHAQSDAQVAKIKDLRREVQELLQSNRAKDAEIEMGKRALDDVNRRADAHEEKVRKITLELEQSEEKRKALVMECESLQLELDDANSRSAASEQMARRAVELLKEEVAAKEKTQKKEQALITARFEEELEASKQQCKRHLADIAALKTDVEKANARAKKYSDYVKKGKLKIQASRVDLSLLDAKDDEECDFFHYYD